MANATNATKVGNLIDNVGPLPDGTVQTPFVTTIAAAGTTQTGVTGAAPLIQEINIITNNTAANGVILPVGLRGSRMEVFPALVTNAPKVYPPVGGTLNFGAVNANGTAPAQKLTVYRCIDDTGLNWVGSN